MSKKDKTKSKEKAKTEVIDMKYGVKDIAKSLGVEPASARIQLRKNKVTKAGKSYGWNSKSDMEAVVKSIKEAQSKPEKKDKKSKKSKK